MRNWIRHTAGLGTGLSHVLPVTAREVKETPPLIIVGGFFVVMRAAYSESKHRKGYFTTRTL